MAGEKFTPGPWRVDEVKTFGAYGVWTGYPAQPGHDGAGYPKQVCSMFSQCFRQVDGGTRPERDANARLIAAAPDLLAALSACEIAMDTAAYSGLHGLLSPAYRESWAVAHRGAKAVLARLTGGVP
jgi:hypothetical protein